MQIPMGNFGAAVAAPQRAVNRLAPAGEGLREIGGVLQHKQDEVDRELKHDRERRASEAKAEERRVAAKAEAHREAAERAMANLHIGVGRDRLGDIVKEIGAGIDDGSIDKTKAQQEYERRSQEAIAEMLPKVPEAHREIAGMDLDAARTRLRSGVGELVTKRDQSDTLAGINGTLEYAERLYRTDPAKAEALATATLTDLGPFAGMKPDQIGKARQTWIERTRGLAAQTMVNDALGNPQALDKAEQAIGKMDGIDPRVQETQLQRIAQNRVLIEQRAELAAQRQQRRADAALKKAEATFNAATALADKGTLAPEYADKVVASLSGTPYQAAFAQLVQTQRQTGPLAAQPIAQQRAALDAINAQIAKNGLTPEMARRRSQTESVVNASESDLKRDPMRAGLERGVIAEIAPLDISSPQAIATTVQRRLDQSQRVSVWAGQAVSPLTEQEAEGVKSMLAVLPVEQRSKAIATVAQAMGPKAAAGLAKQLDAKDRALALAFAMAGDQTTAGRHTSELLLRGQEAIANKTADKDQTKLSGWRATIATELQGVFPNQQDTNQMREAAEFIAAGIAHENGGTASGKDLDRAVRLAVGGEIVMHNGRKLPLPAGMDEDMLRTRLANLTPADLKAQAPDGILKVQGVPVDLAAFVPAIAGQVLMPVRKGEYAILVGERPVMNSANVPIIIKVR